MYASMFPSIATLSMLHDAAPCKAIGLSTPSATPNLYTKERKPYNLAAALMTAFK